MNKFVLFCCLFLFFHLLYFNDVILRVVPWIFENLFLNTLEIDSHDGLDIFLLNCGNFWSEEMRIYQLLIWSDLGLQDILVDGPWLSHFTIQVLYTVKVTAYVLSFNFCLPFPCRLWKIQKKAVTVLKKTARMKVKRNPPKLLRKE